MVAKLIIGLIAIIILFTVLVYAIAVAFRAKEKRRLRETELEFEETASIWRLSEELNSEYEEDDKNR